MRSHKGCVAGVEADFNKMDEKKIAKKKRLENYITKASWADYIFTFVASSAVVRRLQAIEADIQLPAAHTKQS